MVGGPGACAGSGPLSVLMVVMMMIRGTKSKTKEILSFRNCDALFQDFQPIGVLIVRDRHNPFG